MPVQKSDVKPKTVRGSIAISTVMTSSSTTACGRLTKNVKYLDMVLNKYYN